MYLGKVLKFSTWKRIRKDLHIEERGGWAWVQDWESLHWLQASTYPPFPLSVSDDIHFNVMSVE